MDWIAHALTVTNLINLIIAMGIYTVRNELKYIRLSIDNAKECAIDAKAAAARAHDRIDKLVIN